MKFLNYIFPFIPVFSYWFEKLKPHFCRHQMKFWDMKWYMDDPTSYRYDDFNGKIWKNAFCQCQKCGIKYQMNMMPKKWGEWKKSDFTPTKNTFIEVEIFEYGKETKRQKRDRILNNLLK